MNQQNFIEEVREGYRIYAKILPKHSRNKKIVINFDGDSISECVEGLNKLLEQYQPKKVEDVKGVYTERKGGLGRHKFEALWFAKNFDVQCIEGKLQVIHA